METRAYTAADRDRCLAIFDSLADQSSAGRAEYAEFLNDPRGPYFLLEHDDLLAGCGGFRMAEGGGSAQLTWGMVRLDFQRQGVGRFLLMFRLREIGKSAGVRTVSVETDSAVAPFFEKQGFHVVRASGPRVELLKKLSVCA